MGFNLLVLCLVIGTLFSQQALSAEPETVETPASSASTDNVPTPATVAKRKYDYLPDEEVLAITVGNQASEVLIRSWTGKKKLGAAVMFATPGTNADSAGLQAYLRRELNAAGWATIAITPPKKVSTPNFSTKPEEIAKVGKAGHTQKGNEATKQYPDKVWQEIREKQSQFVSQTMIQLDTIGAPYPGKRLLITSGQGAGLTISMITKNLLPKPDILVLINPYMKMKSENQALPKLLAQLDIPVLDIQSVDGHSASFHTVGRRAELSPHNEPYRYSQQVLSLNLDNEVSWHTALKLIEGFALRITKR